MIQMYPPDPWLPKYRHPEFWNAFHPHAVPSSIENACESLGALERHNMRLEERNEKVVVCYDLFVKRLYQYERDGSHWIDHGGES
jgi:hypothetical protein